MMIKNFGARVESVWKDLRPVTKKMLVGALQAKAENSAGTPTQKFSYDTQSDWELSRLLSALDEQAKAADVTENPEKLSELQKLTETCISVLEAQSESAEVFIQLAERALAKRDYKEIDRLADLLAERFSVTEMCEVARQTTNPAIRAIAMETIALMPVEEIMQSFDDPIYEDVARAGLEIKAFEYESEDARRILEHFGLDDMLDG
jgi:hypothetical protein